jgi:hypothetical protein
LWFFVQNVAETVYSGAQLVMQNLADSFAPVLEKLAGTQSELKLSFEDLTLDTGMVKAKIRGQIVLSAAYTNTAQPTPTDPARSKQDAETKTVVTNVSMEWYGMIEEPPTPYPPQPNPEPEPEPEPTPPQPQPEPQPEKTA